MAAAAARAASTSQRRLLDALPRAEQHGRVEVALDAAIEADRRPAAVERDAPVEPDHVAARVAQLREQMPAVPVPKWIVGTVDRLEHARSSTARRTPRSRPAQRTPAHESNSWITSAPAVDLRRD